MEHSTDQNKRATKGTEHTLNETTPSKIGGAFTKTPNPPFIMERAKLWETFYAEHETKVKALPHEKITITLKDGKEIEGISNETTPYDIAKKHLKKSLVSDIIVSKVHYTSRITSNQIISTDDEEQKTQNVDDDATKEQWELWDLIRPLEGSCKLEFCTFEDKEGQTVFWHSSAHILGSALENAYGSKLCIGPALDEGFYYDAYMGNNVIESITDFDIIEKEAKKIATANSPFQRLTITKAQALELFKANPFKVQLISSKIPDNGLTTAYKCGNFIDLCLGPHVMNTNIVKAFKCTKNSSAYWLSKATNDTLQRVYGVAFPNEKLLKEYIKRKEEEEKRDHRNIGRQQGLFMFHTLSPGSCFFYGTGAHIYNKLIDFMRKEYIIRGYNEVVSPNIYNLKLWKTSGHYKNYKENLFMMKVENQGFGLKPMNCPGHCIMFDNVARSYKELPLRMADFGVLHRNEISGALSGLTRVRRFQQDDAHIFCTYDQIMDEVFGCLEFIEYVYSIFGFEYELYLSTRPEKMLGDTKLWDMAEKALADALNKFGKPWKVNPGDGAFYGPKIDIKLFDALKRTHQCGTVQLDFQLPIRFNLMYRTDEQVKEEGKEEKKEKKEKKEDKGEGKGKKEKKQKGKKGEKGKKEEEPQPQAKPEEQPVEPPKQEEPKKEEPQPVEPPKQEEPKAPVNREIYPKDEWDDEEFIWEEQQLKPGFKRPCIVHRAILGSVERCLAILIEHYAGKWPFWLSPRQVCICTVNDKVGEWAEHVYLDLKLRGYQVFYDRSAATLQKKIRNAQLDQFNFVAVIGKEEVDGKCVDIRTREGDRKGKFTIDQLVAFFKTLEPSPSKLHLDLINKTQNGISKTVLDEYEKSLEYNLYLEGDEISEKDKTVYASLKETLIEKEKYPNIFKWQKLMNASMPKQ